MSSEANNARGTAENGSTEPSRRRFFRALLITVPAFAAGFAAAFYALPKSWHLSYLRLKLKRAENPAPPVRVDLSTLMSGQTIVVRWDDRAIFITKRDEATLNAIRTNEYTLADPNSEYSDQPTAASNPYRSIRKSIFVVDSTCTHLGCLVAAVREGQIASAPNAGYYCACHGARFDLAGRVLAGSSAPRNLAVPPHYYVDPNTVVIGLNEPESKSAT